MMLIILAGGVSAIYLVAENSNSYRDMESISSSQRTQTKSKNYEWLDLDVPPITSPDFANSLLEFLVSRRVGYTKKANLIKMSISHSFGMYCFLSAIDRGLLEVRAYTTFTTDESQRLDTKIAQCGLIIYTFADKNGKINFFVYYATGNYATPAQTYFESQAARLRISSLPYNAGDEEFEILAKTSAEIGAKYEGIQ